LAQRGWRNMTTTGPANFFDGMTSARRQATVELTADTVQIRDPAGELLAEWRYAELASYSAPEGMLRLGLAKNPLPARLEIRDRALASTFDAHAGTVKRVGAIDRRTSAKVVAWSLAAVVSAVLIAVFGVPAIVEQVAPLVPVGLEQRLGASVDEQVRLILDRSKSGNFECGDTAATKSGRVAFDKLVRQLEAAATLPLPLRAVVVRRKEANAIALPGGRVYVFQGLVDKADNPDELAGVIAHEMGHIAHRDGVRAVMQAAGLSFLFGMLIGDFTGGGAAIIAVRTVMQSSYSRETDSAADAYGAALVAKLGRDPRALGAILIRVAGTPGPMAKILLSHPEAKDRAAAIEAFADPRRHTAVPADGTDTAPGLIDASEWSALKRMCGATAQTSARGK
jgi:Zn-dependent protease with chaperone function